MPTYKEVSKIKSDFILKREDAIKNTLATLQGNLYDKLFADFVKIATNKAAGKEVDINKLQIQFKRFYNLGFPEVMKQTLSAARSLSDLNQMYFSTLLESDRLDEIHNKTKSLVEKRLGIDENGKLKKGGFTDKILENQRVQKLFVKEVKTILGGNPDIGLMQEKLKNFIIGNKNSTGILESHYRNYAQNILTGIDRSNSVVYADELGLQSFYYGGGLIKTSRKMCLKNNGKIFTRAQAEKWRDLPEIRDMYGDNIADYDPLVDMGGFGCRHTPDWITQDIANKLKGENNAKAKEKNDAFKERNDL